MDTHTWGFSVLATGKRAYSSQSITILIVGAIVFIDRNLS